MAVIKGNSSNNNLVGTPDNDSIYGYAGNDILDGKGGIDTLIGGTGNDTYIVDSTTDKITELSGGGTDTVKSSVSYTLGAYLNNLTLTGSSAINGTGNEYDNIITGNSASNTLNGGAGIDTLIGGTGDDTYIVDTTTDKITELSGGGTDTVQSSVSYTLAPASYLNNLTLTGSSAINGTGNEYDNIITGNSANNILNGGAGIDTLIGGTGDDTYIVDTTTDKITEVGGGGTDTVQSSVSYTLAPASYLNNLTLTGSSAINGTGNEYDNVITGNSGDNILNGGDGNDILGGGGGDVLNGEAGDDSLSAVGFTELFGGAGDDNLTAEGADSPNGETFAYLDGGDGNDLLKGVFVEMHGGKGDDTLNADTGSAYGDDGNDRLEGVECGLNGGNGNDFLTGSFVSMSGDDGDDILDGGGYVSYVFNHPSEGVDTITNFSSSEDFDIDVILVSADGFGGGLTPGEITPEQFRLGSSASDASDRFIYNTDGALFFDEDGTGGAGQIQFATLTGVPLLTNNDIVAF